MDGLGYSEGLTRAVVACEQTVGSGCFTVLAEATVLATDSRLRTSEGHSGGSDDSRTTGSADLVVWQHMPTCCSKLLRTKVHVTMAENNLYRYRPDRFILS